MGMNYVVLRTHARIADLLTQEQMQTLADASDVGDCLYKLEDTPYGGATLDDESRPDIALERVFYRKFIERIEFVSRSFDAAGRPEPADLLKAQALGSGKQPGLMPGGEPNQFFYNSLLGFKNFQKPPQIQDEIDLLGKGRGNLDDTFPVPDKAAGLGLPPEPRLFEAQSLQAVALLKGGGRQIDNRIEGS